MSLPASVVILMLVVAGLSLAVSLYVLVLLRQPPIPAAPAGNWYARHVIQTGIASWYGARFHGRRTASGERFDQTKMTAAHRTLRFGTIVEVTKTTNGRSVKVRINDRGPFIRGRIIDLSRAAAVDLGIKNAGLAQVRVAPVHP